MSGVRHVVVLRWTEGATEEQVAAVRSGLATLPAAIPEIRSYEVGDDLGASDGSWDLVLVAEFDSIDDWATYRDHPAHLEVIADRIRPILAERASVQTSLA